MLVRQFLNSFIHDHGEKDPRPYIQLKIGNKYYEALLDTGASVSVLGKGSIEMLEELNLKYHKLGKFLETADGTENKIEGYINLSVEVNGKIENILFCIVPSLKCKVYLGIDFFKKFGIFPNLDLSEISVPSDDKSHKLSFEQKCEVDRIIEMFPSFSDKGLGLTDLHEHEIEIVKGIKPIKQRFYSVSPAVLFELNKEIDRMLSLGVIEESKSSWNSPITLVRKSNGKVRLCLDARKVNEVTIKDAYPLPLIDGLIGRLKDTKYISSIDLKDAFWQVPLAKDSRDKTAFTVPGRPLFQFKVMPFGLCNAAQSMCRLMDKVIPTELHDRVFVYLDDLLIISSTFEEHLELLQRVACLLTSAKLTINVEKSHFLMKELKYLGFIVGESGLKTDPDKVAAIVNFPVPVNVKQIRRLLGMAGWYRRFIENYSSVVAPITNCLKKGKFVWTDEAQTSFEVLKELLSSAPVLVNPNYELPFFINCDASNQGIGAVLYQKNNDGFEQPIAFMSQKLSGAQKNYSTTELECLAAILAIKKFRAYIEGHKFTVITDHVSLKWLMSQKDLSGRLARWSLKLQSFDFAIEHKKGKDNAVPDALSRVYCESLQEFELSIIKLDSIDFNSKCFDDSEYVSLKNKIEQEPEKFSLFKIHNNRIFIRLEPRQNEQLSESSVWKVWVPEGLRRELLEKEHDDPTAAHGGMIKTIERLRRKFYWPKMVKEVREYVSRCEICKCMKPPNSLMRTPMTKPFNVERPFQRLYVDLLGPYPRSRNGNTIILIVVDHFTKFVLLKPLSKGTASQIVSFLKNEVFHVYGVPESVHTDNGVQFKSLEYKSLLSEFGVKDSKTAFYSPQSNQSERVNRSIIIAIRSYILSVNGHSGWDKHLSEIACALRNSIHESTHSTPHYLVFGYNKINHAGDFKLLREINSVDEGDIQLQMPAYLSLVHDKVRENLREAYERSARQYNLRTRVKEFSVGESVYVKLHPQSDASKKICAKFCSPFAKYIVNRKIGAVNYELKDESGKIIGIFHAKDFKI